MRIPELFVLLLSLVYDGVSVLLENLLDFVGVARQKVIISGQLLMHFEIKLLLLLEGFIELLLVILELLL